MRHLTAFAFVALAQQGTAQSLAVEALSGSFQYHSSAMQACAEMGFAADLQIGSVNVESYDVIVDEPDWSRVNSRSRADAAGPLLSSTLSMSDTTANSFSCAFEADGSAEDTRAAWDALYEALQQISEDEATTVMSFRPSDDFVAIEYCTEVAGSDPAMVAIVNVSHVLETATRLSTVVSVLVDAAGGNAQICWVETG